MKQVDMNISVFCGSSMPHNKEIVEAAAVLGYKPEQVTKILLTHKHADHSGELRSFPNANVYVNKDEMDAAELQGLSNLVPVNFTDGPYYNFPESQKIHDGVYLITVYMRIGTIILQFQRK